jgi:Ni,Fe-hydrogenase I cytochrome b subunit
MTMWKYMVFFIVHVFWVSDDLRKGSASGLLW